MCFIEVWYVPQIVYESILYLDYEVYWFNSQVE